MSVANKSVWWRGGRLIGVLPTPDFALKEILSNFIIIINLIISGGKGKPFSGVKWHDYQKEY